MVLYRSHHATRDRTHPYKQACHLGCAACTSGFSFGFRACSPHRSYVCIYIVADNIIWCLNLVVGIFQRRGDQRCAVLCAEVASKGTKPKTFLLTLPTEYAGLGTF